MFLKDLNNTKEITSTPYGIGKKLQEVYGETASGLQGEVLVQALAHSTLDNFPANWEGLKTALYYLNARIEACRKTLSAWDAYQIRGSINDGSAINSQLAQLPANSSLIANLDSPTTWTWNNQDIILYKGDILFKDNTGEVHYIKSLSMGYYAPVQITQTTGNNFTIKYRYASDTPAQGSQTASSDPITVISQEHILPITVTAEKNAYEMSGELTSNGTITLDFVKNNETIIYPIIKFFICNNTQTEQVFLDNVYTYTDTTFTITNSTSQTLYYEVK